MTKDSTTNEWTWSAAADSPSSITSGSSGTLTFNTDGSISGLTYTDGSTGITLDPGNGATTQTIALNAGTASSFSGITQTSADSSVTISSQDGYAAGTLSDVSIGSDGLITGTFSNGQTLTLGEIMLADFNNPAGLTESGDNLYTASANSGTASIVEAGSSTSSTIKSGYLEQSNVDLSEQFTQMIIAQRGFQANARVITTSDSFLSEVVSLKRE
jgi:flagellar hook protein FlgE